jgi:ABC-type ATPase involved in cell division
MLGLENVSMRYRGAIVTLQPTALRFRRGEYSVLVGQSGAGKSPLLRQHRRRPGGEARVRGDRESLG